MQDLLQGYRDALTENGIQLSDELIHIVQCSQNHVGNLLHNLPCLEKVDAIFCSGDDLAALCIAPLKSMGHRIPEDIALLGLGDIPASQHTTPPLSSVRRPIEQETNAAIELLLKILNKEVPYEPGFHEIETELVIRESTVATKQT